MFHRTLHGWIALALGAALATGFATGPAFAEKGGHGGGKHEAKAEKHAMKEERKAEKHAAKAEEHAAKAQREAFKAQEKAERHARKDFDRGDRYAWRDDRERHAARIMGAAPAARTEVRVVPGAYFTDDHRRYARTWFADNYGYGRACPPGLAKKNNGCMPPGHAKRIVVGQALPRDYVVHAVPQPVIAYLPPAPYGYRYVRVDDDIVLMAIATGVVVDVMLNLLG